MKIITQDVLLKKHNLIRQLDSAEEELKTIKNSIESSEEKPTDIILLRKDELIKIISQTKEDIKQVENYIHTFNNEVLKKPLNEEGFKMSESVIVDKTATKKPLLKDIISSKEEEAYKAMVEIAGNDKKVLVGLTLRLLEKFRNEKKSEEQK